MIRLALRVRREDAEIVLAELTDLAPTGVEETDLGDVVEYAIYGAEGELPALPAVRAVVGDALVEVVTDEVADDWADRWRAFHEPILIKDRLYVRPPWSPAYGGTVAADGAAGAPGSRASSADGVGGRDAPGGPGDAEGRARTAGAGGASADGVTDLVVDPGRAFGTGAHATTRLCLELLVELTDERVAAGEALGPVLDLGCGSGVLGIAASRLGWGPVHGVDHEVASVEATVENARVNAEPMTAARFDLLRDGATAMPDGATGAPLVLANLLRPLLLRVAADGFLGEPPHTLIASGLLVHEVDGVAAAFARGTGLLEAGRRSHGDWAALLLRRS